MEDNQTILDQLVTDDRSRILKAAIPYLPPDGRQFFAVYAKFLELTNTMRLFGTKPAFSPAVPEGPGQLHAASTERTEPLEMLQDIRRYCTGETREKLDSLVNMLAMIQMMQIMNEPDDSQMI